MIKSSTIICTMMLATTPALATETDFQKQMARGVAALDAGENSNALVEFQAAATGKPDDSEATLYLGIARSRLKDAAAESTLKQALRQMPENPRTNYELGLLYAQRGQQAEAISYLEQTLNLHPSAELASATHTALVSLKSGPRQKSWTIQALAGMQYDSNVQLAAKDFATGEQKGDWRGVVTLKGTILPVQTETTTLSLAYSLYQSLHFKLNDYNITRNLAELTVTHRLSPLFKTGLGYSFEWLFLGGDDYDRIHSITPSITMTPRCGADSTLEYRYQYLTYKDINLNSSSFPIDDSEFSGNGHQISFSQNLPVTERIRLQLGYAFELKNAENDNWNFRSHQGKLNILATLPGSLLLSIGAEIKDKSFYDQPLIPGTSTKRSDTAYTGAASLTWQSDSWYAITGSYHHTRNDSNNSSCDYTRGISSILFQARF